MSSSYFKLAERFKLDISFVPFISIETVDINDFRRQRVNILEHTAVIFTSRNTIDHFFQICQELRITVPEAMKYFCLTEFIANYLQKYIVIKRRKLFVGKKNLNELFDLIKKHKEERYLIVCSQNRKIEIADFFETNNIEFTEATFFKVSSNDLSQLTLKDFGILVFFSPADVISLLDNFPDYNQNKTLIACFGASTILTAKEMGLTVDIEAPRPDALSMTDALELYLEKIIG